MQLDEQRFGGIIRLYGVVGLQRLQAAHVAVVGIGGVGSWAAEALARSGVGEITLIDLDDICITNTNRQIHALDGNVGCLKVEAMAERIRLINPACVVHEIADFVTREEPGQYLTHELDGVIDCIDSVAAKAALINWCRRQKIAIVTTGGAGGQVDPTQIQVADLSRTIQDPLAARVRTLLKRDFGLNRNGRSFGVPCVFSTEQLRYPQADGSVCATRGFVGEGVRLDCAGGFGASVAVTASFGFAAAAKMLEKLVEGVRRPSERQAVQQPAAPAGE